MDSTYESPAPASTKRNKWPAVLAVGAFLLGVGVGAAGAGGAEPPAAMTKPEPAPTVTVTADAPEPEVITETVTVSPDSCILALDRAEETFGVTVELAEIVSKMLVEVFPDAVMSAYLQDTAGIEAATADLTRLTGDIDKLTAKVEKIDYNGPADECRSN